MKRLIQFFKDTWDELHKVTWPSREAVLEHTFVVIVSIFFLGFFLWFVDLVGMQIYKFIIQLTLGK